jgi:subtilisin family serine protease
VDLAGLTRLMRLTSGSPDVIIGLIDGPIARDHPNLADASIRMLPGPHGGACREVTSAACTHGTFVAGVLVARRGSGAPAVCPGCTLLVRPIFGEADSHGAQMLAATPEELAVAVLECIAAGARILNLSVAVLQPSRRGRQQLAEALDHAARRGVIVVAAAGNQGTIGGAVLPALPWVIPVAACDALGQPLAFSNMGSSIGKRGLTAPGDGIVSLNAAGGTRTFSGTSAAAPFVTGTAALLWSLFPEALATEVTAALTRAGGLRRTKITPPLLNAWMGYEDLIRRRQRVPVLARRQSLSN